MLIERDPQTNFVQILLDLPARRMRFRRIAKAIGVPEPTVKGWFYDAHQPRFEDGKALLKLHAEVMKGAAP